MDLFGNVKLITEPGVDAPQVSRSEVYDFVESELLSALGVSSITPGMDLSSSALGFDVNPYRINVYGALGIISRLYLNAEEYVGVAMYEEADIASSLIIDSGVYPVSYTHLTLPTIYSV